MRMIAAPIFLILAACASQTVPLSTGTDLTSAEVSNVKGDAAARLIEWEVKPVGTPVDIARRSPRPSSPPEPIARNLVDTEYKFDSSTNARSYFYLTPTDGKTRTAALRVLPLEGGRNFRDIGGYETKDGHTVKWGLVFRSGVMTNLTDGDYQFLDGLGIRTVIDFRATSERISEPTDWRATPVELISWGYDLESSNSLASLFRQPDLTPQDVTDVMAGFYRTMAYTHADKYKEMFAKLISTDAPLIYHCSAGKDRTGVATALLLTALDVPRETILEDYALSEKVVDYMAAFASDEVDPDSPFAYFAKVDPELLRPLMRSNPVYIEAALEQIESDYGSVLNFLQEELGVDDEGLAKLKGRLLN